MLFFFSDTATTDIYTLSLHDALPIYMAGRNLWIDGNRFNNTGSMPGNDGEGIICRPAAGTQLFSWAITHNVHTRSEEHTSELQSHSDLVCRLLLEKKNDTLAQYQNKR